MYGRMKDDLQRELAGIREAGLYKEERQIVAPQAADIRVVYPEGSPAKKVVNFCANNYLGLSSHPKVIQAAREALDSHGYGMSSVRFICGTQDIHRALERKLAAFMGTDDAILYAACLDATGGACERPLGKGEYASPGAGTISSTSAARRLTRWCGMFVACLISWDTIDLTLGRLSWARISSTSIARFVRRSFSSLEREGTSRPILAASSQRTSSSTSRASTLSAWRGVPGFPATLRRTSGDSSVAK